MIFPTELKIIKDQFLYKIEKGSYPSAIEIINEVLLDPLLKKYKQYELFKGECYYFLGVIYYTINQYSKSVANFANAVDICYKIKKEGLPNRYN